MTPERSTKKTAVSSTVKPVIIPATNLTKTPTGALIDETKPVSMAQYYLSKYALSPAFEDAYVIEAELGQGGFGFVVAGKRLSDSEPVAIKFILKSKVPPNGWIRHKVYGVVPLEVYILSHCSHPNIISFLDYYDHDPFAYLVMDLHGSHWNSLKNPRCESVCFGLTLSIEESHTGE